MPRGTGLTRLTQNERHITQTRRRFMLLGQTLAGQQALDIRQCIAATRQLDLCNDAPFELWGYGHTASLVTVAALFEDGIRKINLRDYPANDKDQPDYLNISRFATPAQLLDLAKRRTQVKILKKRGAK
ncbi:MAG: acetylxylan esterase, partial [Limisphaerales bacterium]